MDKTLAASIGAAARAARVALNLTQEEAAERIGVSAEFYARIERGNALPSVTTMVGICAALNINPDTLLKDFLPAVQDDGTSNQDNFMDISADDPPEVRRLARRLRNASPGTLRIVTLLLKELENSS